MKLRASTLMRYGAELTDRTENTFMRYSINDGITHTCALGAFAHMYAILSLGQHDASRGDVCDAVSGSTDGKGGNVADMFDESWIKGKHAPQVVKDHGIRRDNSDVHLSRVITALNDDVHWTRDRIADWIDRLIDEHGYDVYVDVDVDVDIDVDFAAHATV